MLEAREGNGVNDVGTAMPSILMLAPHGAMKIGGIGLEGVGSGSARQWVRALSKVRGRAAGLGAQR